MAPVMRTNEPQSIFKFYAINAATPLDFGNLIFDISVNIEEIELS